MDDPVAPDLEALGAQLAREVDTYFRSSFKIMRLARRFVHGADTRLALEHLGFVILSWDNRFYRVMPPCGWFEHKEGAYYSEILDEEGEPVVRQLHQRRVEVDKTCLTFVRGWL